MDFQKPMSYNFSDSIRNDLESDIVNGFELNFNVFIDNEKFGYTDHVYQIIRIIKIQTLILILISVV